jgi:hypothetical protein
VFTCYAMDGDAVAVASSTQQLAALLQLSEVRLCGAVSKQPLSLPGSSPSDAAGLPPQQQGPHQAASQQLEQPMQIDPSQQPSQQQQQQERTAQPHKPELTVKVPKLGGSSSSVRMPCCTVLLMADVGSPRDFEPGSTYPVLYSWCCGRDAAGRDFCKQHETSRFVVTDRWVCVDPDACPALHTLQASRWVLFSYLLYDDAVFVLVPGRCSRPATSCCVPLLQSCVEVLDECGLALQVPDITATWCVLL